MKHIIQPGSGICLVHNKSVPCYVCKHINATVRGNGRRQRLIEENNLKPQGYIVTGVPTPEDAARFARRLAEDPVRLAALSVEARRPYNVSKERHNIALRTAAREPMLSANPESIKLGLDYNRTREYVAKRRPALAQCLASIIVKPACLMAAKHNRNNAFWGDRLWKVYALKFARGCVAITDDHDFTTTFNTVGELMSAIKQSGWKVVR